MKTSESSRRDREMLAVCLAAIAGYVDAYGFLTFSTFVSFMSGNTTRAGIKLGEHAYALALPAAAAVLSFIAGVIAGTLLTYSRSRQSRRILYLTIAALLALNIAASHPASSFIHLGIAMLSFTMGMMNTALSRVGNLMVNLTFVTGTLSQIGTHLALAAKRAPVEDGVGVWDTHLRRAIMLMLVWLGFLAGALLGGAATPRFGVRLLVLPLLIMLILAAFSRAQPEEF
ncbi:MAG TPA: YoaK family protein [Thermodesulfobacteriota bacterium]|nr:YoaK family protein [Thermodesulfobacteriota bacterium]